LGKSGLTEPLKRLCGIDHDVPLAISTLRGQFADNGEWSADPSQPAIIVGTVDMIGSRLLFSGYGRGFKSRPLHAGLLGQDTLLIHDEAHLEPAFQKLIETIAREQYQGERIGELPWPKLRVMALSATARDDNDKAQREPFELTDKEKQPPDKIPDPPKEPIHHVWQRLKATKQLRLKRAEDDAKIAEEIAALALTHRQSNAVVLIFVRTLDDVAKVYNRLTNKKDGVSAAHVQQLTGTMRGLERDHMADPRRLDASRVFARFLTPPKANAPVSEQWKTEPMPGTVYLVCTSAGEVGIDISADHMVCDLSTFESMAQRLGRVNRYGLRDDTRVDVVYPNKFDDKEKLTPARQVTLKLLNQLKGDASPKALGDLRQRSDLPCKIEDAFAPDPTILPATDILFDAWALTSIRQKMPGRPAVEPYLHGIAEWQPPETYVAWRQEVEIVTGELLDQHRPADLLDDYPLKPHELLRDATDRKDTGIFAQLGKLAPQATVWIVDAQGEVKTAKLQEVIDQGSRPLHGATVVLPPSVGGLCGGMLNGDEKYDPAVSYDVADIPSSSTESRIRVWSDAPDYDKKTVNMRRVRSIVTGESEDDEEPQPRRWEWYESLSLEGGRTAKRPVTWDTHVNDVVCLAKEIVQGLSLPKGIADVVVLAAKWHDLGKRRERFQVTLGNRNYPKVVLAKSGRHGARLPETFRHEFASVFDAQTDPAFKNLGDDMQDLVLHLIAAHHGHARPHFPADEAFDPDRPLSDAEALAVETPRRYARLQRKYGRWGLAYLESLLRAADWAASADPSAFADQQEGT
jgi:CRISPR-associated endonuclease/helicase Cas3